MREEELLQKGNETVMSHMQRLVSMGDKKELACLNSQERTVGQNFVTATVIDDEATVFEELDLIARINQDDDGQLLKIVEGEDKGYTRTNLQHVDEMLEKKWLKCLLETFEPEEEFANTRINLLEVEKGADTSLLKLILLTSIQKEINGYVTTRRELNDNLFLEDKFAGDEKKNVAEGQELWETATSMVAAEATCGVTSVGVKPMLSTIGEMTVEAVGFNPVQKLPAYEFLNKENKQCESITHKTHMHRDFSLDPKTGTTSLIFHYIPFNVTIHIYTCRSIQYHGPKNHRVQYHVRKSCTKP